MEQSMTPRPEAVRRARLWAEFVAFYILAPVVMAMALPPGAMFPVLFGFTVVGIVLLHVTEGFHWRDLTRNPLAINWRFVAVFAALTLLVALVVVLGKEPQAFLLPGRRQPGLLLLIILLYPFLSALPQEIVFRPLFFRRYGVLLPGLKPAMLLNAALFSLAHLMYWNWVVAGMTFAGGLVFAWVYEARRSFAMAVLLHAVAGWIIFSLGLGVYFYSGNVVRPF